MERNMLMCECVQIVNSCVCVTQIHMYVRVSVCVHDLPVCVYVCAFVNQDEGAAKQLSAPVCV